MDKKIATFKFDLQENKDSIEDVAKWLHRIADEIIELEPEAYVKSPRWNYFIKD